MEEREVKRLARSLAQPKEKRSRYHDSHNYVIKPYKVGGFNYPKKPQITMEKKKQFAMKILHTLANLENNIELMLIAIKNER